VKWLSDENFDNDIIRGVVRRSPAFDVIRAQDVFDVAGKSDPVLLAWAAENDRILLTHDLSTIIPAMQQQLEVAGYCAPILLVPDSLPVGSVIEEILLLDECSIHTDWAPGVVYLPLG
jgi:Domain of unknown function (DUF5615)